MKIDGLISNFNWLKKLEILHWKTYLRKTREYLIIKIRARVSEKDTI